MHVSHRFSVMILLPLAMLFCSVLAFSQTEAAAISGRVADPQGLAVSGAKVSAINTSTNVATSTQTNGAGFYNLPNLIPGTYRVIVEKDGFAQIIKPDVQLHVQDNAGINFSLQVGSVTQSVTVEGGAPLVNTQDASVSTVVDQSYVANMPLNGRSFQDLILLTPGTVTQTPQVISTGVPSALGMAGEFSVNGQRTESNYYTVDGVSANVGATTGGGMVGGAGPSGSLAASTALGTTQALVSVDALQEFRVQSSTYSAQYGRNPGGQFSFETKSGTNQWHGTAYEYLRNNYFDADDWFNNYFGKPAPALRQNDFGGTLGGPVRIPHLYNGKDKTFFFVSYEGLRLVSPQPVCATCFVPDAALRTNAPAPLNQALNAWPQPTPGGIDDTANGFAQFLGTWSNPSSLDSTSVRLDHVVSDKLRLFFRFSNTTSDSAARGNPPTTNTLSAYTVRTYTAGITSIFTNRLNNEFRLNYSSNETTNSTVIDALGGSTPVDLVRLTGLGLGSAPGVTLNIGPYLTGLSQQESSGAQRQWNFEDTVSLSLGRHQFKFGVDYRRLAPVAIQTTPFATYIYDSMSAVQTNSAFIVVGTAAPAYPLYMNFSAFTQDEWRVSQRLSISLGLRWEVNPAPGVTQGLKPYTIQGSSPDNWTLGPQGTPLWRTTWYNFAPRLGLAYILHNLPGRETVVRSGVGVFFDTGQQLGSLGFNGPGFSALGFSSGPFPGTVVPPPIVNPPSLADIGNIGVAWGFAPHLQLPYTLQWNASIEQALGKSQAVTVSYVASHASRLLQQNLFSSANSPSGAQLFFIQNGLTSDYDALQFQFRRRLSRGLTALASYSWSHCIDYGSSNFVIGYRRGSCDFDIRNNFSAAFSYDLPNVGHSGFVNAALHHWGLDDRFTARTAFPVPLNGNQNFDPLTGQAMFSGLDLVPNQPVYLYGANCATVLQGLGDLSPGKACPGGRAINSQAFTNATSGFGTAPRNFARGFGAWQMDVAVRRDFPIREGLKLQFRAESFNVFNHPNFGAINSSFGQPTFGQATGTLANSLGILSPLYQQGGPRSMQFALKLVF